MRTLELGQSWLAYIGRRYSSHTYIAYQKVFWRLLDCVPEHYENLTAEHIERFLQTQRLGRNSQNTYLTAAKSLCRYCEEFHGLPNIAAKVKYLKSVPFKQRVLSPEELQKVLVVCNEGEQAVMLFLANTGLRSSELKTLTMECVSPDGRLLYITGKGGKQRAVPLNKTAKANLSNAMNFSKSNKKLYNTCQKLAKRAGIKPYSAHSLRHYYATQMSQHVNIYLLSKCLGHSSVTVTEKIYCHITGAEMQGLSDCLDKPAENG